MGTADIKEYINTIEKDHGVKNNPWLPDHKQYWRLSSIFDITQPAEKKVSEIYSSISRQSESKRNQLNILHSLTSIVDKSKDLLLLEENWDGYGAKRINSKTFDRAVEFIFNFSQYILINRNKIIPLPEISPGGDGSIDADWEFDDFNLLVSFPDESDSNCSLYLERNQLKADFEFPYNSNLNLLFHLITEVLL